jgi:hypothetical protein
MSEYEREFIKAIKRVAGYFLSSIAVAIIGGSAMVYNMSIRTAEKVEHIQRDIKEIKDDINEVKNQYYFIEKR